ncbi:hypothetical protein M426DRAFT_322211, partial [Hypoxylon sp. CI-4A]
MDLPVGFPRDQRVAWPSYGRPPMHSSLPQRDDWSGYSEPFDYRPTSGTHGGVSRKSDWDLPNESQIHQDSMIRRSRNSSQWRNEQALSAPAALPRPRNRYGDSARLIGESAWNEIPESQGLIPYKYRPDPRGENWDPPVVAADRHDHTRRRSNKYRPIVSNTREAHVEDTHETSHKSRHRTAIPPKAPRIPRLPTPDFEDEDGIMDNDYCACCNAPECSYAGSGRRDSKTERQD